MTHTFPMVVIEVDGERLAVTAPHFEGDLTADELAHLIELVRSQMQWSVGEVAAYLGVKRSTVTAYRSRGQMPQPDGRVGRSPWWRPETIRAWRGKADA